MNDDTQGAIEHTNRDKAATSGDSKNFWVWIHARAARDCARFLMALVKTTSGKHRNAEDE